MAKADRELSIVAQDRGIYIVRSVAASGDDSEGNIYHVDANRLSCDCRAGQVRRACRHVAHVSRLLTGHEPIMPLAVSGPAPVSAGDLPDEGF